MEKKVVEPIKKEEKKAIIDSTGDIIEFEEHVSVSGSTNISGGKINKSIRVSGSGKIIGDLECNGLTSSGILKGSGNLNAHGDVSSAGSFHIAGFLYGDEGGDFSGSTQIGNLVNIQGSLIASGSFKAGHFVRGEKGISISGYSFINGNLSSEKKISIDGTTHIEGNVVAEDILIGASEGAKKKQHYRIHGSVLAKNTVNIGRGHVENDVKGRKVTIGRGTEVLGTVYYVDSIDIHKKAKLAKEPVQISIEDL